MIQQLKDSADRIAKSMADAIDLESMTGALDIVIQTDPIDLVFALQSMEANTTKNMLVLAMTTVIIAKMEKSV